jgi:chromosome segregation ATPase
MRDEQVKQQREIDAAADALAVAAREVEEASRERRLAEEQLAIGKEARLDAEARAEALARMHSQVERQLESARDAVAGLEQQLAALEPQVPLPLSSLPCSLARSLTDGVCQCGMLHVLT